MSIVKTLGQWCFNFFFKKRPLIGLTFSLLVLTPVLYAYHQDHTLALQQQHNHRLSKTIIPTEYELLFEPNFNDFTFDGTEQINLEIRSETQTIILHSMDLKIHDVSLASSIMPKQKATLVYDPKNEQIELHFKRAIKPGVYRLDCTFSGVLNDQLRGFYRSSYGTGKKKWLAVTDQEPTSARRMFPCFDEPNFKATYQISARIDPHLVAISNSPILEEKISHGKKMIVFEPTPRMSTYLVALFIGDFKRTGTKIDVNGVPISVWATSGKERLGQCALDLACKILPLETKYFGLPYVGKKLDLIALPDFGNGAMENLGAISFREERLLFDDKVGTRASVQNIAVIVAHEMAHQWVGNLVTMDWWDDLWLNEAFATWMETKTLDALNPAWRYSIQSMNDENDAKNVDQLQTSRPISAPVVNPAQAIEMFDTITYQKGAALLRMLESFIGEKVFQQGVQSYLKKFSYKNATTRDLWTEMSLASHGKVNVNQMMKPWIDQAGLPLLITSTHQNTHRISIKQTRFFGAADAPMSKQHWQIPIVFDLYSKPTQTGDATRTKRSERYLLSQQTDEKFFRLSPHAIIVNKDGVGFFRVQYNQQDFDWIVQNFSMLSAAEKINLLSDLTALAMAGKIPIENVLNFIFQMNQETDPLVLASLINILKLPYSLVNVTYSDQYAQLIRSTLLPLKRQLTWVSKAGESTSTIDLRNQVLQMLGTYGHDQQTIDEAGALFNQYIHDQYAVSPDHVLSILRIIAFNSGEKEYQQLLQRWKSAKNPESEKRILMTLALFKQPSLVAQSLRLSLSPEVRGQDRVSMFDMMLQQKESQEQAWLFIKTHWQKILTCVPEVKLRNIPMSCERFFTPALEQDFQAFFAEHNVPYAHQAVARTLEMVHTNVLFHEKNATTLLQWLIRPKAQDIHPKT